MACPGCLRHLHQRVALSQVGERQVRPLRNYKMNPMKERPILFMIRFTSQGVTQGRRITVKEYEKDFDEIEIFKSSYIPAVYDRYIKLIERLVLKPVKDLFEITEMSTSMANSYVIFKAKEIDLVIPGSEQHKQLGEEDGA